MVKRIPGQRIVEERKAIRGSFHDQAQMAQRLKNVVRGEGSQWLLLPYTVREAIDQILEKLARPLSGSAALEEETWADIQGYCELVLRSEK